MKFRNFGRKIMILFTVFTLLGGMYISSASTGFCAPTKQIEVSVDPRIELLTVVQYLVFGSWRMSKYDTNYAHEVEETFGPFWRHPVLNQYWNMWYLYDFCNNVPHELMLHLSNPPELRVKIPIGRDLEERAGGEKSLNDFLTYLRDFAKVTDFMYFFDSHREFYKTHVDAVTQEIRKEDYVGLLESYYGSGSSGYSLILSPLLYEGGYGVNVGNTMVAIIGPCGVEDDEPIFNNPTYLFNTTFHQFGYSFISPLSSKIYEEIQRCEKLLSPIRYPMSRILYPMSPTWEICMNEHLIRAITLRILAPKNGEKETKKKIQEEYDRSFIYIEYVLHLLEEYETNRDVYTEFALFYPKMQAMFMELCEYPLIPSFLTCVYASHNGVQLAWVDNAEDEIGFQIYRKDPLDPEYTYLATVPINQNFYRDESIEAGKIYQYVISAKGTKGEIFSNHIELEIPFTQPIAPKKLSVIYDLEKNQLVFQWEYPFTADGFYLYEITGERQQVGEINQEDKTFSLDVPSTGTHKYVITAWVKEKDDKILESYDSNIVGVQIEIK